MATEAGRISMTGTKGSVVEEAPTFDNMIRFRVVHLGDADFGTTLQVDNLDRIIEASKHIQSVGTFVERKPRRSAPAYVNLVCCAWNECVIFELGRVVDSNLTRAHRRDIQRLTISGNLHTK